MKKVANDSISEIKKVLQSMPKRLALNNVSFGEFISYYNIFKKYVLLGARDYMPYASSLYRASVMIKSPEEAEMFDRCKLLLEKIVIDDQDKGIKRR